MKLIKKIFISIVIAVVLAIIAFIAVTILFTRSLPSALENNQARMLVKVAQSFKDENSHKILYNARRGAINIFVYGIEDLKTQNQLINELKKSLITHPFTGKVQVIFYTEWHPVVFPEKKGWVQGAHKKSTQLREVEINQ